MDKKIYHKICITCGNEFDSFACNTSYCPDCKEEQHWFVCEECGNRARKCRPSEPVHYCPECVKKRLHSRRQKSVAKEIRKTNKSKAKSIDEIVRIARLHHMSYGEAVAKYGI